MPRMTAKALEALKGSIKKWEGIVAGTETDYGHKNCPLCKLFNNFDVLIDDRCRGCPVFAKTGRKACKRTPYDIWSLHHTSGYSEFPYEAATEVEVKLAQAELDFLRKLLPNKAKKK